MRRRSRASTKPAKARSRKPKTLKAARCGSPSHSGRETDVVRLARELKDALEQQAAAADVLKVISGSSFDLQTILDTLVETATRLCRAKRGLLFRRDGDFYRSAAYYGYSPEF